MSRHSLLVRLTMKINTAQKEQFYFGAVEEFCLHFGLQYAYISLIVFFPVLELCAVPVFISEGISKFSSRPVADTKSRLTNPELINNYLRINNSFLLSELKITPSSIPRLNTYRKVTSLIYGCTYRIYIHIYI